MRAQTPRRFGTTGEQPPARRQHAPDLAQQRARVVRHFERVHEQHAIDRGIGERQLEFVDQRGKAGRAVGHFTTPCAAGMKARQRSASSRNRPR